MNTKYTKAKLLVIFLTMFLMLSSFSVIPLQASNQSSDITFNSTDFKLVSFTNNESYNAFNYNYNVTSSVNQTVNWKIDIYRNDGYTYKFDSLNNSELLIANVSKSNTIAYNFSLSGSYTVQVFWFSSNNNILLFKEYSASNIVGLQNSTTIGNFSYTYKSFWQTFTNSNNQQFLNFSLDIYFQNQYKVTFDYNFTLTKLNDPGIAHMIAGSKSMSGNGNNVEELTITSPLYGPGQYNVVFQWKDLLMYNVGNLNRTITFDFNVGPIIKTITSQGPYVNPGGPYQPYPDHYHQEIFFPFSFLFSLFFTGLIFAFIVYAVYKNQHNPRRTKYFRPSNQRNNRWHPNNGNVPLVPSFCSNCGARVLAKGQYCPDCGEKMD